MINTFLKIGGVKSIEDFYKKYATEDDFFNAHPEARQYKQGGAFEKYQEGKEVKMKPFLTKSASETVNQPNPRYIQDLERQEMLKNDSKQNAKIIAAQDEESDKAKFDDYKAKQVFWENVAREGNPNFKEGYAPHKSDQEKRTIQNKIDNPLWYNTFGEIASYGSRFHGMSPEEIASSYGNPAPFVYEVMANEALGFGVAKAIPAVGGLILKGLKKVGKAINPMTGMKQVRAAYPNLTESAYSQINASHHPIFYNGATTAFGALAPVINEVITGNGDADPEELLKQMGIGAGAGFVGGNMLRNKGLMKQVSKYLSEYKNWDLNMAALKTVLDQVPHKAGKNMTAVEKKAWLDAVEKQKNINVANLGNPAGNINDIAKSKSKYPFDYGDLSTPVREGIYPVESGSGNIRGDWFDFNQTGYTDIPSFNRQVDQLKALAEYGKRLLEKNINIKNINKPTKRLADDAMTSSESDIPLYPYFNNKKILDEDYLPSNMKSFGRQQFERLQPNKYGGTTNKPCYGCGGSYQEGGEQIPDLTVDEFNRAPKNRDNDFRAKYYIDNHSQPKQETTSEILNRRIQEIGRKNALKELNMSFNPTQEFLSGGDVKSIMKQLIKRQEGGNSSAKKTTKATSIDSVINDIRNKFMTTVQNNTERAFAQEELEKLQEQHQMPDGSMMFDAYMQSGGPFNWENPKGGCSEEAKMTPGNPCYLPGYGGNSTPEGTFSKQGTQLTGPYGQMPEASRYFSTSNPFPNQNNLNLSPNPNLTVSNTIQQKDFENPGSMINWNTKDISRPAYADAEAWRQGDSNLIMDQNQMQTDVPNKQTVNSKPSKGFQFSAPSGLDMANSIIGTMDFFSNQLAKREEKKRKKNTSFDAYGMVDTRDNRGDYDPNSGMFRPDSNVPVQFAGTNMGNAGTNQYYAQMGGANPNNEGDEVWLDDEEIEQIKKMGGTITYLD